MQYGRLKKSDDFTKLFRKGKRVYSSAVTVIYSPARGSTLMGIAISKKHGKAVRRNRLKRLVRAAFRRHSDLLNGDYSIVILPRPAESYSYAEIEKNLCSCLKRMQR